MDDVPNHFYAQYDHLKRRIEKGATIDWNGIPSSGKQAGYALIGQGIARRVIRDGRAVLEASIWTQYPSINFVVQLVTCGLIGRIMT